MRALPEIGTIVAKMLASSSGGKWLVAGLGALLGYFLPTPAQQSAALGAAHLILVDTITGIVAARQTGEAITSARLGRVLVKLLGYSSVLSVVAVSVNHIPGAMAAHAPTVTGLLGLIIATEGVSVLENVRKMGVSLPFGLEEWLAGRVKPQKP